MPKSTFARLAGPLALALAASGLGACSQDAGDPGTIDDSQVDSTLADVIGGVADMDTVSSALSDTGLQSIFDGPGSYTLLAPTDTAFAALGEQGSELTQESQRAVLIAVLRDHIVPGHLTPEAIKTAISDAGGSVKMRTLGQGTVTFALDGNQISVTGPDGETAPVSGEAVAASNGVIIPLGGVLVKLPNAE